MAKVNRSFFVLLLLLLPRWLGGGGSFAHIKVLPPPLSSSPEWVI